MTVDVAVSTNSPFQFSTPPPLGLYIHLPWCVHKCPYCDFNSHPLRTALPEQAYIDALLRDLDDEAQRAGQRPIKSIFIGGGTPSLFSAAVIDRLLTGIRRALNLEPDAEITLEANPGAVEQDRFRGFRAAGVNRLSIGIQSFDDACLHRLGRIHDSAEARRAVAAAGRAGFDNLNLDLMYGLPGQDLAGAIADLEQAIALAPTHISHYQLTLEPNTVFHARPPKLPDDDLIFEMQQACLAMLAAAGYQHYEISAYARPGYQSRHNLNYWTFGDYLALGAGAHAKLTDITTGTIRRYAKQRHPSRFQKQAGAAPVIQHERLLGLDDVPLEFMMNALRLRDGFAIQTWEQRTGTAWAVAEPLARQAEANGWLTIDGGRVQPTESGHRFLNELLQLFVPD